MFQSSVTNFIFKFTYFEIQWVGHFVQRCKGVNFLSVSYSPPTFVNMYGNHVR
jgi:hypothetical protein